MRSTLLLTTIICIKNALVSLFMLHLEKLRVASNSSFASHEPGIVMVIENLRVNEQRMRVALYVTWWCKYLSLTLCITKY